MNIAHSVMEGQQVHSYNPGARTGLDRLKSSEQTPLNWLCRQLRRKQNKDKQVSYRKQIARQRSWSTLQKISSDLV